MRIRGCSRLQKRNERDEHSTRYSHRNNSLLYVVGRSIGVLLVKILVGRNIYSVQAFEEAAEGR